MKRRSFLFGAATTLLAAPSIVRASSLMAIRPLPPGRWQSHYYAPGDPRNLSTDDLLPCSAVSRVSWPLVAPDRQT